MKMFGVFNSNVWVFQWKSLGSLRKMFEVFNENVWGL